MQFKSFNNPLLYINLNLFKKNKKIKRYEYICKEIKMAWSAKIEIELSAEWRLTSNINLAANIPSIGPFVLIAFWPDPFPTTGDVWVFVLEPFP